MSHAGTRPSPSEEAWPEVASEFSIRYSRTSSTGSSRLALANPSRPNLERNSETPYASDLALARSPSGRIVGENGLKKVLYPQKAAGEDEHFQNLQNRPPRLSLRYSTSQASFSTQSANENTKEQEGLDRLLSRLFGKTRQECPKEEKTRHLGLVFQNLTVDGCGVNIALQPTVADIFLAIPRSIGNTATKTAQHTALPPPIIDDFTGCVLPGEMCLVLGRPGAGCSTFLKVIGNKMRGSECFKGEVTFGGTPAERMHNNHRNEFLYSPEEDEHYATLKVRDTLKFAISTRTPGKESLLPGESQSDYTDEFLRVLSMIFKLEQIMETKVGNEFRRGISGGEKKRVSIAEALVTKASFQCWDNSTRGLDASTAVEYVQSLRSLTTMTGISACVALNQAGESLYQLFDKVLVIDKGKCYYFGPAQKAAKYFQSLGFVKQARWTTADFLTSLSNEKERQAWKGWEDLVTGTPEQFAKAFKDSETHQKNLKEIEKFKYDLELHAYDRHASQTNASKTYYTMSFPRQVMACTQRQLHIMAGDIPSLAAKFLGIICQSLVVGSLFYNLPQTASGVFTRGGVMFFMLLFNALLALAEITAAFDGRQILLKHKSFSFYRPSAYAIAQTVCDVPLVFLQVVLFSTPVYFMSNLQRTASQFFICMLFLFMSSMTTFALFRTISSFSSSLDGATRVTGVVVQAVVVYTGYLIPPRKMHRWFGWICWLNPIQYGFESLMANEFYNLDIACEPPYLVPSGVPNAEPHVAGADYVAVAFDYFHSHLWKNLGIICVFFVILVVVNATCMELLRPNRGGRSVTVYKRGEAPAATHQRTEKPTTLQEEEAGLRPPTPLAPVYLFNSRTNSTRASTSVPTHRPVLTWQNVSCTISYQQGARWLLQNVQGYVKPGELTALMGVSGAGKTTLLNTLSQRANVGTVAGEILVDGKPLPDSFQRSTGFAEQMDIHESTATVREALRFSAELRQPRDVSIEEKHDHVESDQEQRKRLTIGVELASKPELLIFLDEPTSGLDSGAAFNIIRLPRKLADSGQAMMLTIHAPSSVLFQQFDRLLLLKPGGRTVYFGELGRDSRTMIDYFERNGAQRCPPEMNPAEYMLEVVGSGSCEEQDWGDVWTHSPESQKLAREIQEITATRRTESYTGIASDGREHSMPLSYQVSALLQRTSVALWRSPDYVMGMMILHIFTGLFNGFTFWSLGSSPIDMQSRLFSVFMVLAISPPLIQQLQPRYLNMRALFLSRESKSKMYSWAAFTTAAMVSEIPYRLVAGTLYWGCWYFAPGFPRDSLSAASAWLMVAAFELYYLSFGQAVAAFSPNELMASLLVPIFFLFIISFCGIVVPYASLTGFWKSWIYWLSPYTYRVEPLVALVTHDVPVRCDEQELAVFTPPPGQSCASYANPYVAAVGSGYVQSKADGSCGYCRFKNGNEFSSFSFAILCAFPRRWLYCLARSVRVCT
ncbi:ABC-2 type transporter-domain-containing protein [Phyllosticta citrichinensis]|uniref:ABC-2 type transporter-domain-containing protein n=1 Tax=Phyllosticta citrichinensis TaxID=1130410 RepID=A0ABR1Y6N8_9PEZI